jgi:hypothetical protein
MIRTPPKIASPREIKRLCQYPNPFQARRREASIEMVSRKTSDQNSKLKTKIQTNLMVKLIVKQIAKLEAAQGTIQTIGMVPLEQTVPTETLGLILVEVGLLDLIQEPVRKIRRRRDLTLEDQNLREDHRRDEIQPLEPIQGPILILRRPPLEQRRSRHSKLKRMIPPVGEREKTASQVRLVPRA